MFNSIKSYFKVLTNDELEINESRERQAWHVFEIEVMSSVDASVDDDDDDNNEADSLSGDGSSCGSSLAEEEEEAEVMQMQCKATYNVRKH